MVFARPPVVARAFSRPMTAALLEELGSEFMETEASLLEQGATFDVHYMQPSAVRVDVQSGMSLATLQINLQAMVCSLYKLRLAETMATIRATAADLDTVSDAPGFNEFHGLVAGHLRPALLSGDDNATQHSAAFKVLPQYAATFNLVCTWLAMAGVSQETTVQWMAVVARRVEDVTMSWQPATERALEVCDTVPLPPPRLCQC